MKITRTMMSLTLAGAAALVLAGCSGGSGGGGGETGSASEGATIGVMLLNGDTYFTNVANGVEAANAGGSTIVENYEGDAAKESQAVDNLISRGVDAIVTSPLDGEASAAALQRAADAGIEVICYNTCIDDPEGSGIISAFVLSDQAGMGEATGAFAVDWITENLTEPAVFGVMHCDTFDICKERRDAFFETLDAGGIDYTIAAEEEELVVDQAVPKAEDMLTGNPSINVLWGANDGSTTGLVRAVQSSSGSTVKVFGSDMTPVLAQMLLEPEPVLLTTTGQDGLATGQTAYDVVMTLLGGDAVDPFVQVVPVANYSVDDLAAVEAYVAENG